MNWPNELECLTQVSLNRLVQNTLENEVFANTDLTYVGQKFKSKMALHAREIDRHGHALAANTPGYWSHF